MHYLTYHISQAIDWIMRNFTDGKRQGLQWSLTSTLEDQDYAGDIDLLSSRHQDIQAKSDSTSATIGLKMNFKKTKLMRKNTSNNNPVTINGNRIHEVNEFTYVGSKKQQTLIVQRKKTPE